MKLNVKRKIYLLIDKALSLIFGLICLVGIFLFFQFFCFSTFKIPSDSMEPELTAGDQVIVNKMTHGARLFNLFAAMRGEVVEIYRIPGTQKFQRNEVLVFHSPHPYSWGKLEMHLLKYFIKRCIGIPGDTIRIQNGIYQIIGVNEVLGNRKAQKQTAKHYEKLLASNIYKAFPDDSLVNWNILNFGPLYIPQKGDKLVLDQTNYLLYKQLIEWEQQKILEYKNSTVYMDNQPIQDYQFQHNYYFMAGDKCENSQDSRYWGLLPDDFIVGKAWIILKSTDPYTGEFRWKRFLKWIH